MENLARLKKIYDGRTVLVTGHTGFKGTWLSIWLRELGANVIGYSLDKYDNDILFLMTELSSKIIDKRGDIKDYNYLREIIKDYRPSMIFHLAAQPLVRKSYEQPRETFNTNILGTVNVLECIKEFNFIDAAVIVTTDKCYKNKEIDVGYKETDELGGNDPYSNSKACAELIVDSYRKSFFSHSFKMVATARAGNVIGGGDYAKDRLIPDIVTDLTEDGFVDIRNPDAVRPWQHVIECLEGYLLLGEKLLEGKKQFASAWNFGPDKKSMITVGEVVDLFIGYWGQGSWMYLKDKEKPETKLLYLDNKKAKKYLKWKPRFTIDRSIKLTVDYYKNTVIHPYDMCVKQIRRG